MATSGSLIREARLRAGLTQTDLSERTSKDRAQIARWERDAVAIGFETMRDLLRACGFDLNPTLIPYDPEPNQELNETINLTPKERVERNQKRLALPKKKR